MGVTAFGGTWHQGCNAFEKSHQEAGFVTLALELRLK